MQQLRQQVRNLLRREQSGVAALGVALTIVVVATVVTVGLAQVGANDQKGMANEFRAKQAASIAELGMERGILYLRRNRAQVTSTAAGGWMNSGAVKWTSCAGTETALPCGDGKINRFGNRFTVYSSVDATATTTDGNVLGVSGETLGGNFTVHFVAPRANTTDATPGDGVFYVISDGRSADGSGEAIIRKGIVFYPATAHRPDAPLIAAGFMNIGGTLSVVANPNGGGDGVPLSAWAKGDVDIAGATMQTCHIDAYLSTDSTYSYQTDPISGKTITLCPACECPNDTDLQISRDDHEDIDILDDENDIGVQDTATTPDNVNPDSTYFPDDLFAYVFGIPAEEYMTVKNDAAIITNCNQLGPNSAGVIWITGECDIPSNTIAGSFANPVLLVIEDGDFKMNANSTFMGIIFIFQRTVAADVQINGGPTLIGSLISNEDIDLGTGNYTARYDTDVLNNLARGGAHSGALVAEVPGTWTNYRQ